MTTVYCLLTNMVLCIFLYRYLWVVPLTYVSEVSDQRHVVMMKHQAERGKTLNYIYYSFFPRIDNFITR